VAVLIVEEEAPEAATEAKFMARATEELPLRREPMFRPEWLTPVVASLGWAKSPGNQPEVLLKV
jgi:hypothetical protein